MYFILGVIVTDFIVPGVAVNVIPEV